MLMTMTIAAERSTTIEIREFPTLPYGEPLTARVSQLYRDVFAEIDTLAAQRHMLSDDELSGVLANPRVQKWVALGDGGPVGVSVITNSLHDWPLVSPRFFRRIEPERYAARKIWYVGFVGVTPGHPGVFVDLIEAMAPQVSKEGGMAVMDFCHWNVAVRKLPAITQRILGRYDDRAAGILVDRQEFWGWTFPDPV